jgi:outer membrane protein TolC
MHTGDHGFGRSALAFGAMFIAMTQAWAAEPASPLRLADVLKEAQAHRGEIVAAQARARAAAQRPAIDSALDDPMLVPSLDHLPFMLNGANASLTVEQRFPLSRVLSHRGRAAEAEAARLAQDAQRVALDVELDAAGAFFMLHERRAMAGVLAEQKTLAQTMVKSATARYSAGTGAQADVLRAEIELARLDAATRATAAEVRSAEAMLNASIGHPVAEPVPALDVTVPATAPPEVAQAVETAVAQRPELLAGHAEIDRADAETQAMRSMYLPMAMVRTGPAYTMYDKAGWMLMVGISIPLWRGKLSAGVAEAEAMTDMARADLSAMQLMVEGETAKAREQLMAARERYLALRDDVLPRAKRTIDPTLAGYVSGQLPLVSVVEAAEALWMTQGDLIMAEAELGLAWARFDRALGKSRGAQ